MQTLQLTHKGRDSWERPVYECDGKTYFDSEYKLNDFRLTRMDFTANINVGNRENVSRYIKILHSMGKVKGFSPKYKKSNKNIDKNLSFDLMSKSLGLEFSAYDKEAQSNLKAAKGILRIEIRLMKLGVKGGKTADQIKVLSKTSPDIFMKFFQRIIPTGDYYIKKQTVSLVENEIASIVAEKKSRENLLGKMKNLLELIPKKKSLRDAQKALNYRNIDRVMEAFAAINVSPVTIPKSMKLNHLESLYTFFEK